MSLGSSNQPSEWARQILPSTAVATFGVIRILTAGLTTVPTYEDALTCQQPGESAGRMVSRPPGEVAKHALLRGGQLHVAGAVLLEE